MSATPLVSVILPFSTERSLLREAVDSILQQSFQDFELLLIGNNYNTDTKGIAHSLAAIDDRIRLLFCEGEQLGQVLNTAIGQSIGKYIARMDADDFALPQRLALQVNHLEENPEIGVSAVATGPHPEGMPGEGFAAFMNWQNSITTPAAHHSNRYIEATVAHPAVMMRSTIFSDHGYYPETGPEDFGLWLQWLSAGVNFEKIPEPLLLWRDHPHRLSRTGNHYSPEAFAQVKARAAIQMIRSLSDQRRIILCGAGKEARAKMRIWEEEGHHFDGYSDVKQRNLNLSHWPVDSIRPNSGAFYISLLHGRGKAEEMRHFFNSRGLQEEQDFLLSS